MIHCSKKHEPLGGYRLAELEDALQSGTLDARVKPLVRPPLFSIHPYVPGRPIKDVMKEYGLDHVVKLASNENPLGPSPKAVTAIQQILQELHRYPDGAALDLRAALADHVGLPEAAIFVGNGSDEVIKMIAETFLQPGDEMIVPFPSFSQYDFGAKVMDATIVHVPLQKGFEYDLVAMRELVNEHTKLIYLCLPNNPTGTYLTHTEVLKFVESLPEQVIVACDEAYLEYVDTPDPVRSIDLIRAGYPVLSLRTFSKIYGLAGLRLGYTLGHPDLIHYLHQVREPFNVNAVAQAAAIAALTDDEHLANSRAANQQGKEQVYKRLTDLGVPYIQTQGNFMLIEVGDGSKVFQALQEHGIIVRAGFPGIPEYIRVSIGTVAENEQFLVALVEALGKSLHLG